MAEDINFEKVQLGTAPTGVGGDTPRTAFTKVNKNFEDLKEALGGKVGTAASRDVGEEEGQVYGKGSAYGLGYSSATASGSSTALGDALERPTLNRFFGGAGVSGVNFPAQSNYFPGIDVSRGTAGNVARLAFSPSSRMFVAAGTPAGSFVFKEVLTDGNSTLDSNGFLKAASPIIKLFSDKLEKTEHLEIENAAFERVDTGHYCIKNVPLLSRNGWYIETPKDRNNNVYFTLDYEEIGGELIIKTYTPDYSSGRAENGAPVDILEGRFVSLRFEENPDLYPEPQD